MINTLEAYIHSSLPQWGDFPTNPNLGKKVSPEGKLLPFFGNSVVFSLDEETKNQLAALQRELYEAAGWLLAEPLAPDTFHLTLHDLVNGPEQDAALAEGMQAAGEKAEEILRWWQELPPLKLRATALFNMVSTSVVLGFAPADPQSHWRLDAMYNALEAVVPLGYAMTPHITLAYYRPGVYSQESLQGLKQVLRPVELEITLQPRQLQLQCFRDMNTWL